MIFLKTLEVKLSQCSLTYLFKIPVYSKQSPQLLGRTIWRFLKLEIKLPYDPAIPLLGIYPEKYIIHRDTCNPSVHCNTVYNKDTKATYIFMEDAWIKKLWFIFIYTHTHTHTHIYTQWNIYPQKGMDLSQF